MTDISPTLYAQRRRAPHTAFESQPGFSPLKSYTMSTTVVNELLARQAYTEILESKEQFFTAFFMAFTEVLGRPFIDIEKDRIEIQLPEKSYEFIKQSIEVLRQQLTHAKHSTKPIEIFADGSVLSHAWIGFKLPTSSADLFQSHSREIHASKGLVKKNLTNFFNLLHLDYTAVDYACSVSDIPSSPINLIKYTIRWDKSNHHVFLIKPESLPEKRENQTCQKLFERRHKTGDFELISNDGPIKLHTCIVDLYGGQVFANLMDLEMNEANNRKYMLKLQSGIQTTPEDYSIPSTPTLASKASTELFAEYIYLGPHAVQEKLMEQASIPKETVFELIEIAHMYDLKPLFDCSCNVLSTCVTVDDLPQLLYLAKRYNSNFLRKLNYQLGRIKRGSKLLLSCFSQKV